MVTVDQLLSMPTALALIFSTENVEIPQCSVALLSWRMDASVPLQWETLRELLLLLIILLYSYHTQKTTHFRNILTCLKITMISLSADVIFMKTNKNQSHFQNKVAAKRGLLLLSCKCLPSICSELPSASLAHCASLMQCASPEASFTQICC